METHILEQIAGRQALSTKEFWQAYLIVFNYYLVWELSRLYSHPERWRPPQEVIGAIELLCTWRDIAHEENWAGFEE